MVSKKYEVDESYWKIDGNSNLTTEQKKAYSDALDRQGKEMDKKAAAFIFGAFATSIAATTLLIKRHKIIGGQKCSTQQVHLQ